MLASNLKALLARLWTLINQLDSRLTKSAFAGVGLSIVTGLVIGAFNGCFNPDDKKDDGQPASRAQYAAFVPKFACIEDKQLVMESAMFARLPQLRGRAATEDERIQALVVLADYGRGSRQNVLEMTSLLQGVRPPPQFAKDHQELLDMADLLRKLVDELDRDLPSNMNLAPSVILADPTLLTRLTRIVETATATSTALARRDFSQDFKVLYGCTTLIPLPTPTKVPITIVFPTLSLPPILLTPIGPLAIPTTQTGTRTPVTTVTPFSFSAALTPSNPSLR